MHHLDKRSRVNKFEKRRKNTNYITIFMVIGSLLIILLLGYWLLSSKETNDSVPDTNTPTTGENDENDSGNNDPSGNLDKDNQNNTENDHNSDSENKENIADDIPDKDIEDDNPDVEDKNQDIEINEIESTSDDNSVESTFTGNWQPIGTEQLEPHITQFKEGTADWEEMKQAIALATNLEADQMIIWFIGNNGEQKAIGTVSPSDNSEAYRVYISWITNEGWQPTKVEKLKENDFDKKKE